MRAAVTAALCLAAAVAHADEPFWRELRNPELREFDREIEIGTLILRAADDPEVAERIDVGASLLHFDRAVALRPGDPLGFYWRAVALRRIAEKSHRPALVREANGSLLRARQLDRDGSLDREISFDLGVTATLDGDLEAALVEYERSLPLAIAPMERSITLSNSAEILMGLGRLREAIDQYEAALAEMRALPWSDPLPRVLALYGLAVALDRDDQRGRAREMMRLAWSEDPHRGDANRPAGTLTTPDRDSVFFVPEHDLHYYVALQLETRAEAAGSPEERRTLLDNSANAWREFLASGGGSGPWARQAREHAAAADHRRGRR